LTAAKTGGIVALGLVLSRKPGSLRRTAISTPTASRRRPVSVPAVDRAAGILLALGDGQGEATLTELARHLRIHKSTAHNILATLVRHRFVSRDPATRRYRLGPALAALRRIAVPGLALGALAHPHLVRLQRLSGETATLHGRDGAASVILASEESPHELRVSAPPGHRLPPAAGAVAKVLLAFGGEAPTRLPAQLPAFTPRTIVHAARYLDELRRVRRAGVAYDEMEYLPGVRAVSAPVFLGADREGGAVAVLSIVGVAARVSPAELRRLAGPLERAARALSAALQPRADLPPPTPVRDTALNGQRFRRMKGRTST
jgi:IclR family transcriptional regulator, acetate operon repressor